jgi:hypothetical protein
MTCCPVGKHAQIADIDRAIRAQQAATLSGQSTLAPSYSQIARTYNVRKATLLAHRDVCLAQRTGTADGGVPVRSDAVPERTAAGADDENASDSARSDRYAEGVPARGSEGAEAHGGRATGPPRDGADRRSDVPSTAQRVPERVAQRDANVVVRGVGQRGPGSGDAGARSLGRGDAEGVGHGAPSASSAAASATVEEHSLGVGQRRPPERPRPDDSARARAKSAASGMSQRRWERTGASSVEQALHHFASAAHDVAITDPSVRAHGSYVEEIAQIVQNNEWEDEKTVQRLTRAWNKSRLFVLQCHRDACALIRVARGTRFEQVESAVARWMRIFNTAMGSDAPEAQRVAAEAAKGLDRVLGLVDAGTKVQVNVMQDPAAREFLTDVWEVLRHFPGAPEALRARLEAKRDKLGDPTPILTTGAEVDAAE